MEKIFVKDLMNSVGLVAESVFALAKKESRTTKAGKPYLDVTLRDSSGDVSGKVWADSLDNVTSVAVGDVVEVEFEVRTYQGSPDLAINSMHKAKDYDLNDMVNVPAKIKVEELEKKLQKKIDSVRQINLRSLLDVFFDDKELYEEYIEAPAAEYVHHNYRHGLLHHTLEMLDLLEVIFMQYPDIDRDLVVTGVLLHDIGKLRENSVSESAVASRTTEGKLVGHISLGLEMIHARMPDDFPPQLKTHLDHIILSHQGKKEWGSPVLPASREALAVHLVDYVSTYMNIVSKSWQEGKEQQTKDAGKLFSEYNRYLETSIYLGAKED